MADEIGSVRMDVEEEIVMPVTPVRANQSIPTVTAIILILGAVMVGYAAYNSFTTDEIFAEADEIALSESFTENNASVSPEDIQQYDHGLSNSKYGEWSGVLFASSTAFLITGGILLYQGDRRGIHLGLLGAVILTATNLWGGEASKEAAVHLPEVASLTFATMYYIYACCGVFCVVSAVMPMFFASGRAALSSPLVQLTTVPTIEEEEPADPDEEEPEEESEDEEGSPSSTTTIQNITQNISIHDSVVTGGVGQIGEEEE